MHSRNRLDIRWSELLAGLSYGLMAREETSETREKQALWRPEAQVFSTVRAGWDALLGELQLPRGSKVLCSAVNIPDMFQILRHHGLVPVPVDLNLQTMAVDAESWARRLDGQIRLVFVAHLLGARNSLDSLFELCQARGIPVVEDCAQAFDGLEYSGDPRALASFFSFGPIKTRTALGGGIGIVRDPDLRDQIRCRCELYPVQTRRSWWTKVLKYGVMKMLTQRVLYSLFVRACAWTGRSHDQIINGAVLGLKGSDYYQVLRTRPSAPQLAMLRRILRTGADTRIQARRAAGDTLLSLLPHDAPVLGRSAEKNSWWQFCVLSPDPAALISVLRRAGFDATDGSSRLAPVDAPQGSSQPHRTRLAMGHVVYIPAYPQLGHRRRAQLAAALSSRPDLLAWPEGGS